MPVKKFMLSENSTLVKTNLQKQTLNHSDSSLSKASAEYGIIKRVIGSRRYKNYQTYGQRSESYRACEGRLEKVLSSVPPQELFVNLRNYEGKEVCFSDIFDCDLEKLYEIWQQLFYEQVTLKAALESARSQRDAYIQLSKEIPHNLIGGIEKMKRKYCVVLKFAFFAERRWMIEGPLGREVKRAMLNSQKDNTRRKAEEDAESDD